MRVLYNEGRVVGPSAYELYVRQLLSDDPNAVPMSEREWLCTTIAKGYSMILRVPAGTQPGYADFPLPEGSDLCGCSTMDASLFLGEVEIDKTGMWAVSVSSYGPLIPNTTEESPSTPGEPEDVPVADGYTGKISTEDGVKIAQYASCITSAIMIQPGEWLSSVVDTEWQNEQREDIQTQNEQDILVGYLSGGYKALNPDLTKHGFIRLGIAEELDDDLYLLIRGFIPRHIITGYLGFESHEEISEYINGAFLGPNIFPWACKIVLLAEGSVVASINDSMNQMIDYIVDYIDQQLGSIQASAVKFSPLAGSTISSTNVQDAINEVGTALNSFQDKFVTLTAAEYSALTTKDPDTYYFIKE